MARNLLVICFTLLTSLSFATEIYRSTDQYGNAVFSDKAPKNSTPVVLPPTNTTPATEVNSQANHRPASTSVSASNQITIQSPSNGAIIANGLLPTTVSASTKSPLDSSQHIVFSLDNKTLASSSSTQFTIPRLSRGPHRISATIIDEHGRRIGKDAVDIMVYLPGN